MLLQKKQKPKLNLVKESEEGLLFHLNIPQIQTQTVPITGVLVEVEDAEVVFSVEGLHFPPNYNSHFTLVLK